ncbi:MAG: isochorismatase family protein [Maritimibacter sp.]
MSRPALLLIDIQNDYFPGGNWEVHEMEAAAIQAADALKAARAAGAPVIHIRHEASNPAVPFFQIDATTRVAADLGHHVTVLHDACAAKAQSFGSTDVPAPMVHAAIMAALGGTYAEVLTSHEVISRYL